MNIDELTIKQIKELRHIFFSDSVIESRESKLVGKYCIVRCRGAGVHAGVVESSDNEFVHLKNARRLWAWDNKKGFTLSCIALYGLNYDSDVTKVATELPEIFIPIFDVCELIPCSAESEKSIREIKAHMDE